VSDESVSRESVSDGPVSGQSVSDGPARREPAGHERVVVGVDDGPSSRAALAWAAAEAVLRGARLEIVHAWQTVVPLEPAGMVSPPLSTDLEAGAHKAVNELVADPRASAERWPDETVVRVLEGPAGPVLVEVSEGASLLVVGSKGHSALAEVVLGSVSRHCTHHAPCPVVVLRPPQRERHRRETAGSR
jgi:nucleotide-binding universal stress UspA family protein